MPSIRFANVLMETKPRALSFPTMYYRTDVPLRPTPRVGEWVITKAGTVDFTTYFNALSVLKLLKYTTATAFRLHVDVKTKTSALVEQTIAERLSMDATVIDSVNETVAGDGKWHEVVLDLAVDKYTVLAGFQITTKGETSIRNGWYEVEFEGETRPVELTIATTTFRKEQFIENNIQIIKDELINSDLDIAKHLTMQVVDNGRTLPAAELTGDQVTVIPNENVGGAGGFARGMLAALEQPTPATHVLLMDDDVEVSPESILRTYNLLRIVNDEYKDAFISGAMLNIEDTQDMKEDTGFISPVDGTCVPLKPPLQLTKFVDVVYNECFDEQLALPEDAHRYAAWWYCCIPTSVIRENGMPLPIFVRYDDVEYGIRCNPTFMTMNGICVWHAKFEIRYNAGVERYQTVRNSMIGQMTTGLTPTTDAMIKGINRMVDIELRKFNYTDAELALDGFEDFLKGPRFIEQPVAQEAFMRANREKEHLLPFKELEQQAAAMGIDGFDPNLFTRQTIDYDEPRSIRQRAFDFITRNGQRLVATQDMPSAGGLDTYALIPAAGWIYPAGSIHNENVIVAIDWATRTGIIRTKDVDRFREITRRWRRDLNYFKRNADRLQAEYLAAAPKLESQSYWKQYLDME